MEESDPSGSTTNPAGAASDEADVRSSAEASTRHTHPKKKVDQTKDDTDEGWGEPGDDDASARWLRENRPPHWD